MRCLGAPLKTVFWIDWTHDFDLKLGPLAVSSCVCLSRKAGINTERWAVQQPKLHHFHILSTEYHTTKTEKKWCFQPDMLWNRDNEPLKGRGLVLFNNAHASCTDWAEIHWTKQENDYEQILLLSQMFQDAQEILLLGKLLRFAGQQEMRDVDVKLSYILVCVLRQRTKGEGGGGLSTQPCVCRTVRVDKQRPCA